MFLYFIKEFDFLFLILEHHSDSENFAVKRIEAQIVDLEQMIRLKLTGFLKPAFVLLRWMLKSQKWIYPAVRRMGIITKPLRFSRRIPQGRLLTKGHIRSPSSTRNPNNANPGETWLRTSTQEVQTWVHEIQSWAVPVPGTLACSYWFHLTSFSHLTLAELKTTFRNFREIW